MIGLLKKYCFALLCLFTTLPIHAQNPVTLDSLYESISEIKVERFKPQEAEDARFIDMHFGASSPKVSSFEAGERKIQSVELFFSDYPKGEDFEKLNKRRMNRLIQRFPELRSLPPERWTFVRQTDCETSAEARTMFHGFKLMYSEEERSDEWHQAYKLIQKMMAVEEAKDSTVLKAFEENSGRWKNALVVSDWTGSMYPYTTQLLSWLLLKMAHEEDEPPVKSFCFFNDGDDTPDLVKLVGKTGGIYHVEAKDYQGVLYKMIDAMVGGRGGDAQENDLEALLSAAEHFGEAREMILIADNNSPVRDISLLPQLKTKVHVVLCGTYLKRINVQYLNIARSTGGEVYTIEESILDLADMKEGSRFSISGQEFIIQKDGNIEAVSKP